jgi:hypothetical protein
MTTKKAILRMSKVPESLCPGAIQILDFGFWILDLKPVAAIEL